MNLTEHKIYEAAAAGETFQLLRLNLLRSTLYTVLTKQLNAFIIGNQIRGQS